LLYLSILLLLSLEINFVGKKFFWESFCVSDFIDIILKLFWLSCYLLSITSKTESYSFPIFSPISVLRWGDKLLFCYIESRFKKSSIKFSILLEPILFVTSEYLTFSFLNVCKLYAFEAY
jgi:hypothetical protein